jgi:hypothetical protein
MEQRLSWFSLQEEEYVALQPNAEGIICSEVFPGLWLAVTALLAGDMSAVMTTLQTGLATMEHEMFLQNL